jgi:hypothetical protein
MAVAVTLPFAAISVFLNETGATLTQMETGGGCRGTTQRTGSSGFG